MPWQFNRCATAGHKAPPYDRKRTASRAVEDTGPYIRIRTAFFTVGADAHIGPNRTPQSLPLEGKVAERQRGRMRCNRTFVPPRRAGGLPPPPTRFHLCTIDAPVIQSVRHGRHTGRPYNHKHTAGIIVGCLFLGRRGLLVWRMENITCNCCGGCVMIEKKCTNRCGRSCQLCFGVR